MANPAISRVGKGGRPAPDSFRTGRMPPTVKAGQKLPH